MVLGQPPSFLCSAYFVSFDIQQVWKRSLYSVTYNCTEWGPTYVKWASWSAKYLASALAQTACPGVGENYMGAWGLALANQNFGIYMQAEGKSHRQVTKLGRVDKRTKPKDLDKMVWYLLNNYSKILPYINIYKKELLPQNPRNIDKLVMTGFAKWFKSHACFWIALSVFLIYWVHKMISLSIF